MTLNMLEHTILKQFKSTSRGLNDIKIYQRKNNPQTLDLSTIAMKNLTETISKIITTNIFTLNHKTELARPGLYQKGGC